MTRPDPPALQAQVTHWRAEEGTLFLRLWLKDELGRVVSLAHLEVGESQVEWWFREAAESGEAHRQLALRLF